MGLLPILYEVQEKNQKPNPPRFKKAIRIYEDRYVKAMKRFNRAATNTALKNLCSQEASKYGRFFK